MVPAKNLGELCEYSGYFYERDFERGLLKNSQQTYAKELAAEHGVEWVQSVPLPVDMKLTEFDKNEVWGNFPFRKLVVALMLLATRTRSDIANAVKAMVRYCASLKQVHWKTALVI